MEVVGNALTVIAGFLGVWYIVHRSARDTKATENNKGNYSGT